MANQYYQRDPYSMSQRDDRYSQQNGSSAYDYNSYYNRQPPPAIPGKVISSENDITPADVPMNYPSTYFPTSDGKEIYVKFWTRDGTIATNRYILADPPTEQNGKHISNQSDTIDHILNRMDELDNKLDEIKKLAKQNQKSFYYKNNKGNKE